MNSKLNGPNYLLLTPSCWASPTNRRPNGAQLLANQRVVHSHKEHLSRLLIICDRVMLAKYGSSWVHLPSKSLRVPGLVFVILYAHV